LAKLILSGSTSGSVTLESPAVSGTTTLTLPTTTDTLVGKTTTDTLTNKTLTSPAIAGTPTGVGVLTSGTSVASTSGTSIDFTSIPSWVKRITVMFSGVSTSGTSIVQIQLGSSSFATSGYLSGSQFSTNTYQSTTGLALPFSGGTDVRYGSVIITNVNGNLWNAINAMYTTGNAAGCGGGSVTLSGTLDRIRITTVNGTDTFDAGTINILYE
jgi:hypothetical protein